MLEFGKRVKIARKMRKMTQRELAEKVKTHPNTISALERVQFYPGLVLGLRLADALDVHLHWLCGMLENHRRGIQLETDQEEANYRRYMKMSPEERQQFADYMQEFLTIRNGANGRRETTS